MPSIGEKPNQPKGSLFSNCNYGKKTTVTLKHGSIQHARWFHNWPWIHYDEFKDVAFCCTCVTAVRLRKLKNVSSKLALYVAMYVTIHTL